MRLEGKAAVIMGAGQAPTGGQIVGNGRATALTFAREGASVLCVDRHLASAQETAEMITAKGGDAQAVMADVTDEAAVSAAIAACHTAWGRLDILHNNVGLSVEAGDAPMDVLTSDASAASWKSTCLARSSPAGMRCRSCVNRGRDRSSTYRRRPLIGRAIRQLPIRLRKQP